MKLVLNIAFLLSLVIMSSSWGEESYDLAFSTYLGGSNWEHARDVAADSQGNVYLVGGTASADFPTTPGAYQRTLSTGGSQAFGPCDVFVTKFGPGGNLIWSTYIGGPDYDRAYAVEVDSKGYVYVAGRAGPGFPVKNALQPDFDGVDNGSYGMQNAFVLKLLPDGSDLVWATYVGVSTLCRDLAIDSDGDVYVPGGRWNTTKTPPSEWFANAYQKTPPGGKSDCGVIKIKSDGSNVLWATWLGGSGDDNSAASIRVDRNGYVYIGGSTFSSDFPTTAGAHDRTYNGQADFFVACLTPDGSDLVYGTYLGGSGHEWISTHNLAIDDFGNAYAAIPTGSPEYPTTAGAFQRTFRGGNTDLAITKLSPTGALLASTLIGGSDRENADGVYIDASGNVFVTGETQSTDFPLTANPYQPSHHGGAEAVLARLSADFSQLLYATFMGGRNDDNGRTSFLGQDGSLYVAGSSNGAGWPVKNAYQGSFGGGSLDNILAKFAPANTITVDPRITYQTITGWEAVAFALEPGNPAYANFKDELFDLVANDLGIDRVRLEIRSGAESDNDNWSDYQAGIIDYPTWRSRRYATVNDNGDPCDINWSGFHFSEMDRAIDNIVLPLRDLLRAKGESLRVNVNYVAFTGQITGGGIYIHNDPDEYAEFVLATYQHLQNKYGWVPDLWEVILEPDNVSQWNGKLIGQAIVAAANRLKANGFSPAFVAPSNTNMANAITYFNQMIQVPGVLQYLKEFSYHRYGGVSLQNLQTIASRAKQYNLDTSMLEWWSGSNSYRTLHEDLKVGNNSAWQQGVIAGSLNADMCLYKIDDSDPANPKVLVGDKTKFTRQYYKFIRPGAVRIEATSNSNSLDPLAFINRDGRYVVVVKCSAGGDFFIGQLPAGTYGIKYTTSSQYDVDLPDQVISAGQALTTSIPAAGVLTAYAKAVSPDTEAPSTPTGLAATAVSSSQINLSWLASTDNVAVAGYRIYRDGVRIAFSPTNSFVDTDLRPLATYTYRVSAYDAAGNESGKSLSASAKTLDRDLETGLVGYWKFDEGAGTAASDSSGAGNNGDIIGPLWVAGKTGQALDFDGTNDHVRITTNLTLNDLSATTMAAWIFPRVDSHWHVLDKGDGDKRIYAEGASRTINGRIRYTGAHAYSESAGNTISLGAWQHVALTWSTSEHKTRLYHNGTEVNYAVQDIGSGSVLDDASYPYVIGARGALGTATFFDGVIDEVRLYNRALNAQEIRDLYAYAPSARTGDLNKDYRVNFTDLLILAGHWLSVGWTADSTSDIIEDGSSDFLDFAGLAENWLSRWNQPPVADIITPQHGAQLAYARAVEIEADAHDADGSVTHVEFFAEGTQIGQDSDGADGWKTSQQFAVGSYRLTAQATDNEGAAAHSPALLIHVVKPPR